MDIDFEMKLDKGRLRLAGPLKEFDTTIFKRTLMMSLEKCRCLEIDIDNVTEISSSCIRTIGQVYHIAKQEQKSLVFDTRYPKDTMMLWLRKMARKN